MDTLKQIQKRIVENKELSGTEKAIALVVSTGFPRKRDSKESIIYRTETTYERVMALIYQLDEPHVGAIMGTGEFWASLGYALGWEDGKYMEYWHKFIDYLNENIWDAKGGNSGSGAWIWGWFDNVITTSWHE